MTLNIFHSINIIKQIKEKPIIPNNQFIEFKFKKPGYNKLIIFDLDETLIHCQREEEEEEDFDEKKQLNEDIISESSVSASGDSSLANGQTENQNNFNGFVPDIWLDIQDIETGEEVKAGFTIRPYAIECLKQANKDYEVAIFTAGNEWFADPIIDYLDPTGELIQHRFFRHHTTYIEDQGFFVKDLRIFKNIELSNMLIVDNYVYSFAFQLENGIPIVPFMGDKTDTEMIKLIKYLKHIYSKPDLRVYNDSVF